MGNLAEQVYAQLKAEMNDFSLVPGDRFSEAELGQRLGVSRTPVREALFRLRNEGFWRSSPSPAGPCGPSTSTCWSSSTTPRA